MGAVSSRALVVGLLLLATAAPAGPVLTTASVDFETVAAGTRFGEEMGNQRGQAVLQQNGVVMTLAEFRVGEFRGFYRAEVGGAYADAFPTAALETNNINVVFDFTGLPFVVNTVVFEFAEFGGVNNFAVNGGNILELSSMQLLPAGPAPGVTALTADGIVALSGPITSLLIGGQELVIDNVTAVGVPEPGAALLLALGGWLVMRRRHGPRR